MQVLKLSEASPLRTPTSRSTEPALKAEVEESKSESTSGVLPEPKKPITYATKVLTTTSLPTCSTLMWIPFTQCSLQEEAKEAFKELLASVAVASHWNWDQTMRLIANDPRYSALKSIGEKKACFNEYLHQRAKEEKEEARMKAKQTRDAFFTLLELSPELKTGTRYSKAALLFEDEPRWKVSAVHSCTIRHVRARPPLTLSWRRPSPTREKGSSFTTNI